MIRACSRCVLFIITLVSASAMGQKAPDCPDDFKQWVRERVGPVVFPEGSSHLWAEFTQLATDLGARAVKTWVGAEKPGDALARMQSEPYRDLIHRFGVVHFNISPAYIIDKYASGVIHPDSLKAIRDEWRDITRFLCRERTSADQVFLLSVGGELNVYVGTAKAYPDFPVAAYVNACHAGKEEALAEFKDSEGPRIFSVAEIQGDIEYERFAQKWGPQFDTDLVSLSYYTFYLPLETSLEILARSVTAQGPFGARRLMLGEYGPSMESCNWNQAAQVRWHDEILRQAFKQHVQFAFFYEIADHDTVIETGSHDGLIRWSPTATPRFTWAYYGDLYHQREPVLPEGDVYEHRERPLTPVQGDAPNLLLSELKTIGDMARAGHDTEFSVCVTNDGHAAAKDTIVNFFVDDRLVSWVWLGGLEPGGKTVVKSTQQDPRFVWRARGGHHRVTAIVDPSERISESNETDNVAQTEVEVDPDVGGRGERQVEDGMRSDLYNETYRPQFHFSPKKNWTNDPNGLVFYKGEYHLFFQHNPFGINWGNMHWGHAISKDFVHWEELAIALAPDEHGTCFSGSAVVDWENTAGFQTGEEKAIVAFYTGAPVPETPGGPKFTECIAYSNDRGRTWTKYEKNPVLDHIIAQNRDPKVFRHAASNQWIMALFLDKNDYALFASRDLKEWRRLSDVQAPGCGECPDFFELPVDGDPARSKWLFLGGNGNYLIGSFDGNAFVSESGPHQGDYGNNFYATQSYNDIPGGDGRRIQIAWMNGGKYPDMPFNQQMSFPCELTLRSFPEGFRMCRLPVREIETLRESGSSWERRVLRPDEDLIQHVSGDLFDIGAEFELMDADELGFNIRGETVSYSAKEHAVSCLGKSAPLNPVQGRIRLRILVDRTSLEVFGNDGRISMTSCFLPKPSDRSLEIFVKNGAVGIVSLRVYPLRSAWPRSMR